MIPENIELFYKKHAARKTMRGGNVLFDLMMPDDAQYRILSKQGAIALNENYETQQRIPGFFAVGDDAGDDLLCVTESGEVVQIPVLPMHAEDAISVAQSLDDLVADGEDLSHN